MRCTRLAENTGRKNYAKNRHLCTIAQICLAVSSQLRHVSTIRKKNLSNSNIFSRCPQNMANFGRGGAWHSYSCGQTVGWIKMPLGKVVVLGPGHVVLDGDPVVTQPPTGAPLHFRPMPTVAKRSPISATAELLYTFSVALAFASKSCVLLYWHRYCTAPE